MARHCPVKLKSGQVYGKCTLSAKSRSCIVALTPTLIDLPSAGSASEWLVLKMSQMGRMANEMANCGQFSC